MELKTDSYGRPVFTFIRKRNQAVNADGGYQGCLILPDGARLITIEMDDGGARPLPPFDIQVAEVTRMATSQRPAWHLPWGDPDGREDHFMHAFDNEEDIGKHSWLKGCVTPGFRLEDGVLYSCRRAMSITFRLAAEAQRYTTPWALDKISYDNPPLGLRAVFKVCESPF